VNHRHRSTRFPTRPDEQLKEAKSSLRMDDTAPLNTRLRAASWRRFSSLTPARPRRLPKETRNSPRGLDRVVSAERFFRFRKPSASLMQHSYFFWLWIGLAVVLGVDAYMAWSAR